MFSLFILLLVVYAIWYFLFRKKIESEPQPPLIYPTLVTVSLAVMILTYNFGLYGVNVGLSLPATGLAVANAGWVVALLLSLRKEKRNPLISLFAAISVLSGGMLIWRANGFIQSVNLAVMSLSSLLIIFYNTYDVIHWQGLWLVKQALRLIPESLQQIPRLLKNPKSADGKHKFTLIGVIKTISITAVALVIFVALLSSADPVFAQIIKDFQEEAFGRTFMSLFLTFTFLLLVTLKAKSDENHTFKLNFLSFGDIFIPVTSVITLFAVFILIQLKYLFGSQADFQSFNLTYSEYVRKGFTELLITAFIGGLIAYIVMFRAKVFHLSQQLQLKVVNVVLIGELFFMLASAFKRDLMYVDVYGLTRVRIVGGLFLIWLAGLLVLLLMMTVVQKMKEKWLWLGVLVLSVGVWAALNIMNVDAKVAKGAPGHHDYVDYFYINNLSTDGVMGWQASLPSLQTSVEELVSKPELTDIEKSKLAGVKLALVSLQRKRVYLFRKYADEAWVLAHCKEVNCDEYSYKDSDTRNDFMEATINHEGDKSKPPRISSAVENIRSWQHFSWSEYRGFQQIKNNESAYFADVDMLLQRIRDYQQMNSVSLYKQEYRLLREFKYPFITINLSNYYPQELRSYSSPGTIGGEFSDAQRQYMASNQASIKELSLHSCGGVPAASVQITGMLMPVNRDDKTNLNYWFWDKSSLDSKEAIIVTIPENLLPKSDEKYCETCRSFFAQVTLQPFQDFTSSVCPNKIGYKPVVVKEIKELN